MRLRPCWLPLWVLLGAVPRVARAHSVTTEVTVGSTQTGPTNPRTGNVGVLFSGLAELSDAWAVHLDLALTHDNATPPVAGATFHGSGGNIGLIAPGVDFSPSEHWNLGVGLGLSPRARQLNDSLIEYADASGQVVDVDALLATATSSISATAAVSWNSAGFSDLETAVDVAVTATGYRTEQAVQALDTARGPVTAAQAETSCRSSPRAGCGALLAILGSRPDTLGQTRLLASVTETLFDTTDLGLSASFNAYSQDPATVGYFSLLTVGRSVSLGNGLSILPPLYTLRLSAAHRFGRLAVDAAYQYLRYVGDDGQGNALSARVSYKFSRSWRAYLRLAGQVDVPTGGGATRSGSLSAGVRCTF